MSDATRTFIALTIPDSLAPRLARLQSTLAHDARQGRWSTALPWHLTLAFLGDVPHADLTDLCRATRDVAARHPRFKLTLQGTGAFPNPSRPSVVWAGVGGDELSKLMELQSALVTALKELRYPPDRRPYNPHVTLARLKPGKQTVTDMTALLGQFARWSTAPFSVDEVTVFGSNLSPEGPVYTPMSRAPLGSRKA